MKKTRKAPLLIRIFSYFFVFMGFVAFLALVSVVAFPEISDGISINFISIGVTYSEHPFVFTLLSGLYIVSASVGLSIVFQKDYAYDLAIIYSSSALVLLGFLTYLDIGTSNDRGIGFTLVGIIFGGFLFYLLRRRSAWIDCQ